MEKDVGDEMYTVAMKLQLAYSRYKGDTVRRMYEAFFVMYKDKPLPPIEALSDRVKKGTLFWYVYSELRYRQMFVLSPPTVEERIDSWFNYFRLFQALNPLLPLPLPKEWVWDMVDGFVDQFQSFREFRATSYETLTEEDKELLDLNDTVWGVFYTLKLLQKLVKSSSILGTAEDGGIQLLSEPTYDDRGQINAMSALGYFSMVGLLRVYCLLGDFKAGLKCLEPINIFQPGFYTSVIGSHITTVYHCCLAYFMLDRYNEAVSGLQKLLVHISKQDSEQVLLKTPQMYALLAVCQVLCSPDCRTDDENVKLQLNERFGPKISQMELFDDQSAPIFRELLEMAWPNFKKSFPPHIGDPRSSYCKRPRNMNYANEDEIKEIVKRLYPPSSIPFDPEDKEPFKINKNQLDDLIERLIFARISQLKLK